MNAQQLVKLAILRRAADFDDVAVPADLTGDQVDEIYEEQEYERDAIQDAKYEVREGEVETDVEAPYSRHLESNSVAACVDGQWVGWTYWYGGGKHAEPEAVDWIEYAYLLDCVEEQKVVTVRNFTKKEEQ